MSTLAGPLKRLIPKTEGGRNVVLLIGGSASGQALVMVAYPLLTRLYSPADFGLLAVYASILVITIGIGTLHFDAGIPIPTDDEDAAHLAVLALGILVVVCLLCLLAIAWLGTSIATFVHAPALVPYLWLMPLSLFSAGLYLILNSWAIRQKAFLHLAKTKFSQGAGQASAQVGLGCLHGGPLGLLLGDLVGRAAGCNTLARLAWKADASHFRTVSWRRIKELASRYRQFPLLSLPSSLVNSVVTQLPFLVLAAIFDPRVVGLYALGQRALAIPMGTVGNSVQQVYLGECARLHRTASSSQMALFWKTLRRQAMLGVGPVCVLAISGPWLFAWVFGEAWREAGTYVQLLAPMFLLQFIATPVGGTLSILERQHLHLAREIVRFALMASALAASWYVNATAVQAIACVSAAGSTGYLLYVFTSWWAVKEASLGPIGPEKECET